MEIYEINHVLIVTACKLAIRLRARFCYEKTVSKETLKRRAVRRLSFPKCNNL